MGECVIVNDKQEPLVDYRCSINESDIFRLLLREKGGEHYLKDLFEGKQGSPQLSSI
jgi:hypothetical protein